MHKFKVNFYLRPDSKNQDVPRTVQVRIYLNHERDYLTSSKVVIPAKLWDAEKEMVKLDTLEGRFMNQRLTNLRNRLMDIFKQNETDEDLSLEIIKKSYQDSVEDQQSIPMVGAFFKQYILENEEILGQDTTARLKQIAKLFGRFVAFAYNEADINFQDIDMRMIYDFESYLYNNEGYTHLRTLENKIYSLKTLIGAAHELGMIKCDLFENYSMIFREPNIAKYLTMDEILRIQKKKFNSSRLDKVRDYFLFSCYTGLSLKEMKTITKEHIVQRSGLLWIEILHPDGNNYLRPLLAFPASLIEKYGTNDKHAPLFPAISSQKMNLYLKEIAELCNLDKRLTYRWAIKSYKTNLDALGVKHHLISLLD